MNDSLALEYDSRELRVRMWEPSPDKFLDRSCNIYGGSGTGKTVLLREILCRLQREIDCFYVFSGTAGISQDSFFTNEVVPSPMLYPSLNMETIKNIIDYQEVLIQVEHQSRNADYVIALAEKLPSNPEWSPKLAKFRKLYNTYVQRRDSRIARAEALQHFQQTFCESLLLAIKNEQQKLPEGSLSPFSEGEQLVIKQRGKPAPRVCIILDDLADAVQRLKGKDLEQLTKMYIRGRHYRLTFFMILQDITFLKSALRVNGMINCFTCADSARKFIQNGSSGLDREAGKRALAISDRVFDDHERTHNVLVYLKESKERFWYTRARPPAEMPVIRLCADRYWVLAQEIERRRASRIQVSTDNAFRSLV